MPNATGLHRCIFAFRPPSYLEAIPSVWHAPCNSLPLGVTSTPRLPLVSFPPSTNIPPSQPGRPIDHSTAAGSQIRSLSCDRANSPPLRDEPLIRRCPRAGGYAFGHNARGCQQQRQTRVPSSPLCRTERLCQRRSHSSALRSLISVFSASAAPSLRSAYQQQPPTDSTPPRCLPCLSESLESNHHRGSRTGYPGCSLEF
jgi:hypothetical protein